MMLCGIYWELLINPLNGGVIADNALIGQGRTEGTAVVPQKEKTLCTREWVLFIWNDKLR